tara:strand:- start:1033 stop:1218 length:186 start_codon:yes stop_codon:yes gene_type:complete
MKKNKKYKGGNIVSGGILTGVLVFTGLAIVIIYLRKNQKVDVLSNKYILEYGNIDSFEQYK